MNENVGNDRMDLFLDKITKFNEMYNLRINDKPTDIGYDALVNMADIIKEEAKEFDDIINNYKIESIDTLTDIADILGDLVVYCFTFAKQWGIPLDRVIEVIMESNFSKLGDDGKPIHDERGKVCKGPDYLKPEPRIKEIIKKQMKD